MTTIVDQIIQGVRELRQQSQDRSGSVEKGAIKSLLHDAQLQAISDDLSITAFHSLSALETGPQTGIELSSKLNVTRGGITRAVKKLAAHQLVSSFQKAGNKKRVYFQLTPTGQRIAVAHDQMHQQLRNQARQFLQSHYDQQELGIICQFLKDLGEHSSQF